MAALCEGTGEREASLPGEQVRVIRDATNRTKNQFGSARLEIAARGEQLACGDRAYDNSEQTYRSTASSSTHRSGHCDRGLLHCRSTAAQDNNAWEKAMSELCTTGIPTWRRRFGLSGCEKGAHDSVQSGYRVARKSHTEV